jgi:DNA-binding transcriptional MocR family regulator
MAIPLARFCGAELLPIPLRPDGLDLGALAEAFARSRPALLYTVPNFHNPTGITTGQAHREALLALAERHRVPIVEDGFEEEMKYFGKAILPVKSMDQGGIVIYLGTFSKVVFPGLRVGWIAAERECIQRLLAIKRFCTLSGNTLTQAAVHRFLSAGAYEPYLRRVHTAYRRRMLAMLRGLRDNMPAGVAWTQPAGGYTLWLEVLGRSSREEPELLAILAHNGVHAVPGSTFFPQPPDGLFLRLSIARLTEPEITDGCARLGRALARFLGG